MSYKTGLKTLTLSHANSVVVYKFLIPLETAGVRHVSCGPPRTRTTKLPVDVYVSQGQVKRVWGRQILQIQLITRL